MSTTVIDIHTHLYPRLYIDRLAVRAETPRVERRAGGEYFEIFPDDEGRLIDETYWSVDEKLQYMETAGISQSVVSLGNPWLQPFSGDEGRQLSEELNREFASLEARTDGRVVGMGTLAEHTVTDIVESVERVSRTPGLYGAVSGTRLSGLQFDDARLDPVWEALAGTETPLLVHPHHGLGLSEMDGFGHALPLALGFTFETTTALARLVMSGVLDRHPSLRVIGSHGGGAIPYLAGRLDGCWAPDEYARKRRDLEPSRGFEQLYLDALVYHPRALRAASELVGTERMAFGTDHPFSIADPVGNIAAIKATFNTLDAEQVFSRTAKRLFSLPMEGKAYDRVATALRE